MIDDRCADLVVRECEFFASEACPRPGYEAGDLWSIPVEQLGGGLICTALALIRDGKVTYYDMLFREIPEEFLEDD